MAIYIWEILSKTPFSLVYFKTSFLENNFTVQYISVRAFLGSWSRLSGKMQVMTCSIPPLSQDKQCNIDDNNNNKPLGWYACATNIHTYRTWIVQWGKKKKSYYFILLKVVLYSNFYLTLLSFCTIIFFQAKTESSGWFQSLQIYITASNRGSLKSGWSWGSLGWNQQGFHPAPPPKHAPQIGARGEPNHRELPLYEGNLWVKSCLQPFISSDPRPALDRAPSTAPSSGASSAGLARGERRG